MRSSLLLFSALHFLLLTLLFLSGVFSTLLFLLPSARYQLMQWMDHVEGEAFLFVGAGIILFAFLLILLSMHLYRTQYYRVQMGYPGHSVSVDLDVIRSLVSRYWQNHFPSLKPHVDVLLRDNSTLELFAEFPPMPLEDHKRILQKIEADLSQQLARYLGYRKPFLLSISPLSVK